MSDQYIDTANALVIAGLLLILALTHAAAFFIGRATS